MSYTVDEILMPLALTVVIDHRVREPERKAFIEQARGLLELFEHTEMTDAELKAWFDKRAVEIEENVSGRRKNTLVLKTLSRFKDDGIACESIYDAMVAISVSDDEFVKDESDLIKSAATLWGFQRPPLKVERPS